MSQGWKFKQLGGDREEITLDGYAAPFGRPRIKSVYEPGKELRESAVRYPGNSGAPTRHISGTMQDDFELSGRWMDKFLGEGTTHAFVQRWLKWVDDAQRITISWGDFASYTGVVKSIKPKWESQTDCVWTIRFLIDTDDSENVVTRARAVPDQLRPDVLAQDIETWMNTGLPSMKKGIIDQIASTVALVNAETGEVFEALDDAISTVAVLSATAVAAVRAVDSFESATFAELQRIRTSVHQVKTAAISLQQTADNVGIDSYVVDRQAEDDIAWLSFKSESDVKVGRVLGSASLIELLAEAASRGKASRTHTARGQDTWESISVAVYGDAAGADRIRQANGIKFGNQPVAGRLYQIPG